MKLVCEVSLKKHIQKWATIASNAEIMQIDPIEKAKRALKRIVNEDLELSKTYVSKKADADSRNLEFTLTFDDWKTLKHSTTCAYSGVRFVKESNHPKCASMERINPNEGYTLENTVVVTRECNTHKSQLDSFIKGTAISDAMKLKLLRKAAYQLEKKLKNKSK